MRKPPPRPKDPPFTMEQLLAANNLGKNIGKRVGPKKPPQPKAPGKSRSTGANRAAASRSQPKPEAWGKAVDKYWSPPVKIAGKSLLGITKLRYPKNDPKKNFVMNQLTSKERREKAMDKQHNRYSK